MLGPGGGGAPGADRLAQRGEPGRGIGDERQGGVLRRVERRDVELDEAAFGTGEEAARGGGEIGEPRADREHEIGLGGERVGGGAAGDADRADRLRMVAGERALAGLGLGDRDAVALGEIGERGAGEA